MRTSLLGAGLIPLVAMGLVVLLTINFSLAAQTPIGPSVTITPPQPMAAIEFVREAGVERWQVKLNRGGAIEDVYLRISGSSCTHMGEIYQGMLTPLYDDMTFKTKNGRTCTVQAIER
jgi:hypothetical protein